MAALLAPTLLLVAALDPCVTETSGSGAAFEDCAAPRPVPNTGGPAWGGYLNGRIPESALCPLGPGSPHHLRCDAAAAFRAMSTAHQAEVGRPLQVSDAYRDLDEQRDVWRRKPELAARPGHVTARLGPGGGLGRGRLARPDVPLAPKQRAPLRLAPPGLASPRRPKTLTLALGVRR